VRQKRGLFLAGGAALVLLLLAGLVGGYFLLRSRPEPNPAEGEASRERGVGAGPSDLDFLDPTAQGFVTLKVAEVWNLDVTQKFYKQIRAENPLLEEGVRAVEGFTGLGLGDIERVSAVVTDADKQIGWGVAATRKPYDRKKILAQLKGAREARHEDKTYHVLAGMGDRPGQEMAVYFVNDRIAVAGPQDGLKRCLSFVAAKKSAGPLRDAIQLAAGGKHHLVAGVHPPAERLKEFKVAFKGMAKGFVWVIDVRAATLTVDLGSTARLDATLTFADEDRAREAFKTLDVLRGSFELLFLPELEERWKQTRPAHEVDKQVEQIKDLLKGTTLRRKGKSVNVQFKGDVKALGSILLVPAKPGPPGPPRRPG
jgi:hypothetical protein